MKQCSFLFMNGVFRDAFKIKINISICIVVKFSLYIDWFSNSLVFTYTPLIIVFSVSYLLLNSSSVSRVSVT